MAVMVVNRTRQSTAFDQRKLPLPPFEATHRQQITYQLTTATNSNFNISTSQLHLLTSAHNIVLYNIPIKDKYEH